MSDKASMEFQGQSLEQLMNEAVDKFGAKLGNTILRKTTLQILTETVKNNKRVDTGAMRNNWQVSINLRGRSDVLGATSKTGATAKTNARMVVKRIKKNDIVYIYNNLPYTAQYERTDKMLKKAIIKVTANLEKNLEKTRL